MAVKRSTDELDDDLQAPVDYRYGSVIDSPEAEAKKALHGRSMIRERVLSQGKDSIYNMTGLVRTFPLDPEDLPALETQFTYYAYFSGRAEELAVQHTGGNIRDHNAVICNRVTSGILGVMLALVKDGDNVLSVVGNGRSHPSVQQAVELADGNFYEVRGADAGKRALDERDWSMVVVTPLTPQKYHLTAPDVARIISMAKGRGLAVVADDAHMASRSVFYEEPVSFGLGDVDVTVWSLDKHVPGPRCAAVVAKRDLMETIQTQVFRYGLEAQSGHYVAGLRGMEAYDPEVIRVAGRLAKELFARFRSKYGERVYQAGPGVAMSAPDFGKIVLERAGDRGTPLIAEEMSIAASFIMLRDRGMVTIPTTGFPGAAPTFRLMMHPDGGRLGLDTVEVATEEAIDGVIGLLDKPEAVRNLVIGSA